MFCSNCGKVIADDAKFCNFCGLPVKMTSIGAPISQPISVTEQPVSESISEPISQPVTVVEAVENTSEPISESVQTADSVPITLPEPPSSTPMYSAPRPENIPNMGAIPAPTISAPQQHMYQAQPNPQPAPPTSPAPEKTLPQRKYTLGHIMMCLSAVAIMAIVAGIFAGLYFSAI